MTNVTPKTFHHRFHIQFLPSEPLIGINTVNCEVLCEDEQYRNLIGFEIGFLFFTFSYGHMRWS